MPNMNFLENLPSRVFSFVGQQKHLFNDNKSREGFISLVKEVVPHFYNSEKQTTIYEEMEHVEFASGYCLENLTGELVDYFDAESLANDVFAYSLATKLCEIPAYNIPFYATSLQGIKTTHFSVFLIVF